jgi:DNA-binding CsgD family transcriptional regulator/PAS domain-containing protein
LDSSTFSDLLGPLYEGLAFPDRWPDFLTDVARTLECTSAGVVFIDHKSWRPQVAFSVGFPPDSIQEFDAYYGALNPIVKPVLEAAYQEGFWLGLARSLVSDQDYKKSEYYNDWGRKYGVFHAVNGTVTDSLRRAVSLTVTRAEQRGPLGSGAVELVGRLLPHLKRAFQLRERMENLRAAVIGAREALDKLETAVIALSGDGRVLTMTRRAEALLERNDGLRLVQGRLAAANPSQAEQLDEMVRSAALTGAGRRTASGGAMRLHRGPKLQPLTVTVMPFHSSHVMTELHPCALVFISDPAERPASRASLLSTLYRLTPAECRLADLLVEELDLRAVSERMRITRESARFMLKSIFRKTETHRQSQLIRILMSLPGQGCVPSTAEPGLKPSLGGSQAPCDARGRLCGCSICFCFPAQSRRNCSFESTGRGVTPADTV